MFCTINSVLQKSINAPYVHTQKFNTMFIRAHRWAPSSASRIQSIHSGIAQSEHRADRGIGTRLAAGTQGFTLHYIVVNSQTQSSHLQRRGTGTHHKPFQISPPILP